MDKNLQEANFSPSEITIRVFTPGDEEAVVRLWNKVAEAERDIGSLTVETFRKKVIENPNFDPKGAFLAYSAEVLVGFCLVAIRREPFRVRSLEEFPAFISAIMVHPFYRRRRIGFRLISGAVGYAKGRGKKEIRIGYDNPIPLFIGVDINRKGVIHFFIKQGFEEEEEIIMTLPLSEFEKETEIGQLQKRVAHLGILVSQIKNQDVPGMLELLKDLAIWWFEPMAKDIESSSLDMANVFVAKEGEAVVGFARVDRIRDNGDVWGILTHPSKCRKGIGTLMLFSALNKLKRDGVTTVHLTTGSQNFPAQRIYDKAGFRKVGAFAMFRKQI